MQERHLPVAPASRYPGGHSGAGWPLVWGPQLTGIAACWEDCGIGEGVAVAVTVAVGTPGTATTAPPALEAGPGCAPGIPAVAGAGTGRDRALVRHAGAWD